MFTHQFLLRRSIDERDIKTRDKTGFVKRESFFLSEQSISYNYEPDSFLFLFFFFFTRFRRNHKLLSPLKFFYSVQNLEFILFLLDRLIYLELLITEIIFSLLNRESDDHIRLKNNSSTKIFPSTRIDPKFLSFPHKYPFFSIFHFSYPRRAIVASRVQEQRLALSHHLGRNRGSFTGRCR